MKSKIVGERVKKFMAENKINQSYLAVQSGIPQSNISAMLLGKRDIGRLVDYIEEKYGLQEGTFYKDLDEVKPVGDNERKHFISVAKAGLLTAEQGQDYELQPVIAQFPNYDYTVEVRGDSMMPEYKSGDVVACLDVTRSTYMQWGRTFLLNTSQGVIIKKVYEDGEFLKCVSVNEDSYPPFNIPKSEVYSIGLVVSSFRIG